MKEVKANEFIDDVKSYCMYGIENMKSINSLADLRDEYNYRYGIIEGMERTLKFINVDNEYLVYRNLKEYKYELTKEMRKQIKRLI